MRRITAGFDFVGIGTLPFGGSGSVKCGKFNLGARNWMTVSVDQADPEQSGTWNIRSLKRNLPAQLIARAPRCLHLIPLVGAALVIVDDRERLVPCGDQDGTGPQDRLQQENTDNADCPEAARQTLGPCQFGRLATRWV